MGGKNGGGYIIEARPPAGRPSRTRLASLRGLRALLARLVLDGSGLVGVLRLGLGLVRVTPGEDAQEAVVIVFNSSNRPPESLDGTLLLPRRELETILTQLRAALGIATPNARDGSNTTTETE